MIVLPVQEIRRRGMSEMKEPWANGPVWAIGSNVPKHVVMFEEADIRAGAFVGLDGCSARGRETCRASPCRRWPSQPRSCSAGYCRPLPLTDCEDSGMISRMEWI